MDPSIASWNGLSKTHPKGNAQCVDKVSVRVREPRDLAHRLPRVRLDGSSGGDTSGKRRI